MAAAVPDMVVPVVVGAGGGVPSFSWSDMLCFSALFAGQIRRFLHLDLQQLFWSAIPCR